MASLDVELLYRSTRTEPGALRRIRRLARPFEIGFAALSVLAGLFVVMLLVLAYMPGGYVTFNADGGWLTADPASAPADALPAAAFPLATQVAGLFAVGLIHAGLITALWSLHKLFAAYRRGEVFADAPVRLMRRAGLGLIVFAATPGLMQPLLRVLGSPDRNWFHGETLPLLLVGASLFLFANILALGIEIERENRGFI